MQKIFFSYTLRDGSINKAFLFNLKQWVCCQDYDCYIDILENEYNKSGFQQKLLSALSDCDVFCRIDSADYMSSEWALDELNQAKLRGMKMICVRASDLKEAVENKKKISSVLEI